MRAKQKMFIIEYLKDFNATQAAIRAGYSPKTAYSIGQENLKKPEIKAKIEKLIEERCMTSDEVLLRLAEHARSNVGDYIEVLPRGQAIIKLEKAKEAEQLHLIKKLKITKTGPEIELYDQQAALQLIGKHLGLFKEQIEQSGEVKLKVVYEDGTNSKAEKAPPETS